MKSVCEIASRLDARHASVRWIEDIELGATVYLELDPNRRGAMHLKRARQLAQLARQAIDQGQAGGAAFAAMGALQSAWAAEMTEGRVMIDMGVKTYRKTQGANDARKVDADRERDEWRRQAAEVWKHLPELSKIDVAKKIDTNRWNTVRRFI